MKNKYIIVKHTPDGDRYYNGQIFPIFQVNFNYAQIFTNKRTAKDTAKYADRYASNSQNSGEIEIIKL